MVRNNSKGELQRPDRKAFDNIRLPPQLAKGCLSYERDQIDGNYYHGNMLLDKDVSNNRMKQIAAAIALCVDRLIPNTK